MGIRVPWLLLVHSHLFIFHLYGFFALFSIVLSSLSLNPSLAIVFFWIVVRPTPKLLFSMIQTHRLFAYAYVWVVYISILSNLSVVYSFVCSLFFVVAAAAVGFTTKLFFMCVCAFSVFYICFSSACSFFPSLHVLLHSIASHLIQLNSFSIVFTIMLRDTFFFDVPFYGCIASVCLYYYTKSVGFSLLFFVSPLPFVIYSQIHLYNLYDNVEAL